MPHTIIDQVLAARDDATGSTTMIVNDLGEMDLMIKGEQDQLGEKLRQCLTDEHLNVITMENAWSEEPGAFNSLCYLTL